MERKFGFLTVYSIEYVYDFLGAERIKKKMRELKDKPTMGIRFEDFLNHDIKYAYFSGKGVLWVFGLLIDWFNDLDFVLFLYEKSKSYNEENYFNKEPLKSHCIENIRSNETMIKIEPEQKKYWESQKLNPYWMEFHFFICKIIQKIIRYKSDSKIENKLIEIFQNYYDYSDQITYRLKADEVMWPAKGLGNGIFVEMEKYFEGKCDNEKVSQIKEKAKKQGWRPYIFN